MPKRQCSVVVSDIFYFFRWGVRGARRGWGFLKIPEKGGGSRRRGGGEASGREGVCGEFGEFGGLNIFFRGRNSNREWHLEFSLFLFP